MKNDNNNSWLTISEAANLSGYNHHTLKEYIKSKRINNVKIEDNLVLIHKDEVGLLTEIRLLATPVSEIVDGKEWYSVKETAIITGYSETGIMKSIRTGKITNHKKIGYYNVIHISVVQEYLNKKHSIQSLNEISKEDKEWFTLSESEEITGIKRKTIWGSLKKGNIADFKKVDGIIYIHKDVVKLFNNTKSLNSEEDKEWYSTKEAERLTNCRAENFTRLIRSGEITNYINIGVNYYIHKSVIDEYIDIQNKIDNEYISYNQTAKLLKKKLSTIQDMAYAGKFEETIKFGRHSYIKKTIVEEFYKEQNEYISTATAIDISGLAPHIINKLIVDKVITAKQKEQFFYIEKKSFYNFIDILKNGFNVEDVCASLNIEQEDFYRYVELNLLKTYKSKVYGTRVTQGDLELFKEHMSDFYTVQDVCRKYDLKSGAVLRRIREGIIIAENIDKKYYLINKESFERYILSTDGIKLRYYGKKNYQEFFYDICHALYNLSRFKETIDLYRDWAISKINDSNSSKKKSLTNYLVLALERLLLVLNNELFNYSDNGIALLLKQEAISGHTDLEFITGFINFCKTKRKCLYLNNYNFHSTIDNTRSFKDKTYTKNEWVDYFNYLINMDMHKEKAINSRRYAETWLFLILHLSLSWRASDIVKMPNVPLEIVGIEDFEWFYTNDFTLELAQTIINEMRARCKGILTDKTHARTHFVIGLFLIVPTALAFVICELHRRNSASRSNSIFTYKPYRTNDYKLVLGDKLPSFSSKKSNSSLMTYQFETAVNKEGRAHIAYQLCSYARSHKAYVDKQNEVTKVYLHTTNTDASAANMAFHLFERGFFGWQIGLMLNLIFDAEKWDISKKTELIKGVSNEILPISVDGVSEYLNTRHDEAVSLLKELMLLPNTEIREKLIKISEFKSPALIDHSQCIIGIEKCPYKNVVACLGCKYRVSTNYVLELVNSELFKLLSLLEETPISAITSRIKFTRMINKLMFILMDFKIAYREFDNNYLNSFINFEELKVRYQELEITKFLFLEE